MIGTGLWIEIVAKSQVMQTSAGCREWAERTMLPAQLESACSDSDEARDWVRPVSLPGDPCIGSDFATPDWANEQALGFALTVLVPAPAEAGAVLIAADVTKMVTDLAMAPVVPEAAKMVELAR